MAENPGPGLTARQPRAVHSALTVLEAVAELGAGASARELSARLGLPRATTYRLLNLLVEDGYLVRTPDLSGFALGTKVAQLAAAVAPARVPTAARELIAALRAEIRGGVHVAGFGDGRVHVIDEDPDFPLHDPVRLSRDPAASALGTLMMLAGGDPAVNTAASELAQHGAIGRITAGTGYGCLAVPVYDREGRIAAGLAFAGPRHRVVDPAPLVPVLTTAAARLSPYLT